LDHLTPSPLGPRPRSLAGGPLAGNDAAPVDVVNRPDGGGQGGNGE
jgi:hypothetical protein